MQTYEATFYNRADARKTEVVDADSALEAANKFRVLYGACGPFEYGPDVIKVEVAAPIVENDKPKTFSDVQVIKYTNDAILVKSLKDEFRQWIPRACILSLKINHNTETGQVTVASHKAQEIIKARVEFNKKNGVTL